MRRESNRRPVKYAAHDIWASRTGYWQLANSFLYAYIKVP